METSTQTTELLSLARSKDYSQKELGEFERALNFASLKLENKKRLSGELFFNHNLRVGQILVENGAPPEVVLGGILHGLADVKSEQRIRQEFGEEVWHLIKEVVEVREIKSKNQNLQAEALKRILLTTLKDVRVILIKLANKLDNLRHLGPLPPEEQKRISEEVLEVYAPLAYRLGAE
ncbi:MAG: HD domain-containing protein, partial [Nanoarchaeota archaeon]